MLEVVQRVLLSVPSLVGSRIVLFKQSVGWYADATHHLRLDSGTIRERIQELFLALHYFTQYKEGIVLKKNRTVLVLFGLGDM